MKIELKVGDMLKEESMRTDFSGVWIVIDDNIHYKVPGSTVPGWTLYLLSTPHPGGEWKQGFIDCISDEELNEKCSECHIRWTKL